MTANSLFPAYVKIDYHSAFGVHSMELPTKDWAVSPNINGSGSFNTWDGTGIDADDMVNALVDLIAPFFKSDGAFEQYTIYILDTPTSSPVPVAAKALTQVGTNASTYWSKAVQTTFSFRTDLFGLLRLVLLDAPAPLSFNPIRQFATSPEAQAIRDELALDSNGWSARDNGQVVTLTQIAYTLNEKLRKSYRMN